jgi:hypothetical protein
MPSSAMLIGSLFATADVAAAEVAAPVVVAPDAAVVVAPEAAVVVAPADAAVVVAPELLPELSLPQPAANSPSATSAGIKYFRTFLSPLCESPAAATDRGPRVRSSLSTGNGKVKLS